jgi:hypothetical protein
VAHTTKKLHRVKLRVENTRTRQAAERELDTNGHGKLTEFGIESLLHWGATLYAQGWDKEEFNLVSATPVVREVLDVRKRH